MYTSIIEFSALVLVIGGLWHAARQEGRTFGQAWFVSAYLAAVIRETVNQVMFQVYVFSPGIVRIGVAPALVTMLSPGIFYLAYHFARRWVDPSKSVWLTGLLALITACFALPIEATAAQLRWWLYTVPHTAIFGGVPLASPLVWGGSAAVFYVFFQRIMQTRLNEQGKLYALIALSPVIAAGQLLLLVLLNM